MMPRCEERHPYTRQRCRRDAGHLGTHEPEHTEAEREATTNHLADELMVLVRKWVSEQQPMEAVGATLIAMFVRIEELEGSSRARILRTLVSCLAERELSEVEFFKFCADTLGVGISEIRVAGKVGQA